MMVANIYKTSHVKKIIHVFFEIVEKSFIFNLDLEAKEVK
jgi:hypothetical protein